MALSIRDVSQSMHVQNLVNDNKAELVKTMTQLSSGKRFTGTQEDAVGMAVVEKLNSHIRGNDVGIRNANDAISLLQVAESGLTQIVSNLNKVRELAMQSASSGLSDTDRSKLQTEVADISTETYRILSQTEYNGVNLFNSSGTLTFQVGHLSRAQDQIQIQTNILTGISGSVTFVAGVPYVISISALGHATGALSDLDSAISTIVSERARFGALQNRFSQAIQSLQDNNANYETARGRIEDTDYAESAAQLTRLQILQQSTSAILTQANASPRQTLSLLTG